MSIDIKKLITSLSEYFPKDLYLIKNKFIISGKYSDSETAGNFLITLNDDIHEEFNNHKFNPSSIYYLNDIKTHKDDFFESFIKIKHSEEIESLLNKLNSLYDISKSISEWKDFSFNEEELRILFEDRLSIGLKKDEIDNYVIISKSIIPGFSKSNYSKYIYSYNEYPNINLHGIVISYHTQFFDSFMQYFIIP